MRSFGEARNSANGEATCDIHGKRRQGESRRAGRMQYEPAKQVSRDRTQKTATTDQQKVAQVILRIESRVVWEA